MNEVDVLVFSLKIKGSFALARLELRFYAFLFYFYNPVFRFSFSTRASHLYFLYAYLLTDHMLTLLGTRGKQSSILEQVVPDALLSAGVGMRQLDLVCPV